MDNQNQEFSFYFDGQRITDCSIENLQFLYKDVDESQEIVESILKDKSNWVETQVLLKQERAKVRRSELTEAPIELFGVYWQVDKSSRDNINEAIAYAKRNGVPPTELRQWILTDNSVRDTQVHELEMVMSKYTERLDSVFTAYAEWREGDKLEEFNIGS